MRFLTTFLLAAALPLFASAEDSVDYSATYDVNKITSSVYEDNSVDLESSNLYDSVDEVFAAFHNKLFGALFGRGILAVTLIPQTSDDVINEVKGLDNNLFKRYLLPFNPSYAKIIVVSIIVFTAIAYFYIVFVNNKYLLERLHFTTATDEKEGAGLKSSGRNHLVRVLFGVVVLTPFLAFFENNKDDGDALADGMSAGVLNKIAFYLVGESIHRAELIVREFAYNESVYNPAAYIPAPDSVAQDLVEINNFASCVASENEQGHIEVKSHINGILDNISSDQMSGFKLDYVASYKNCHLKVSTMHDKQTIMSLGDELVSKTVGIDDLKFVKTVEALYKAELDAHVKLSLQSAMMIAGKIRGKADALSNDVTLDLKGWYRQCDTYLANAINSSLSVEENLAAYNLLPLCFSRSLVKKFSYPNTQIGKDFDETRMSEDDAALGTRWVQLCSTDSGDPTQGITKGEDEIKDCAKKACNFELNANSIFACSALVNSVTRFINIDDVSAGGFLMAPVLAQKQLDVEIPDDAKSYLKKFSASSERYTDNIKGRYATRDIGDIIYSKDLTISEEQKAKKELVQKNIESSLFKSVDSVGSPNFYANSSRTLDEVVVSGLTRFTYCVQHRGEYAEKFGAVCGNSYQEASRLVHSYVNLIAISYALTIMPSIKNITKDKSFGSLGASKNLTGSAKKIVLAMLAGAGVGAVLDFVISDDELDSIISYFMPEPDPYSPDVFVFNIDPIAKGVLASIVLTLSDDGLIMGAVRTLLAIMFVVFSAFSYLPALLFVTVVGMALTSLVLFPITLPLQISNAFAETGASAGKKIRVLVGKWQLVISRFPLCVAGFFVTFVSFDSLVPPLIETAEALAIYMEVDGLTAKVFSGLFGLILYCVSVCILLVVCLNAINQFYQVTKTYLVESHGQDEEVNDLSNAINTVKGMK